MTTKLIKLDDGTLVEVEAKAGEVQQISSSTAEKVQESLDKIKPMLVSVCQHIVAAWNELEQDLSLDSAEVELGLSFEGEGNLYITKAKAGANINVKLSLKPKK